MPYREPHKPDVDDTLLRRIGRRLRVLYPLMVSVAASGGWLADAGYTHTGWVMIIVGAIVAVVGSVIYLVEADYQKTKGE